MGSPARHSHVSMPFWTSTSSRLSLAIVLPAPPLGSLEELAEAARRRSTTLIWEQVTAELSTVMPLAQPMPPQQKEKRGFWRTSDLKRRNPNKIIKILWVALSNNLTESE